MRILNRSGHFIRGCCAALFFLAAFSELSVAAGMPEAQSPGNDIESAETDPVLAKDSLLSRMQALEQNFGIFAGGSRLADSHITTTYQCFICTMTSGSQDFQFEQGSISGIRGEMWGKYFGTALEISSTSNAHSVLNANGASASIGINSVSIIPMLRMPFFATESMPGGKLNLYGGLGLDFITWISMNISMPGQPPLSAHISGRYNNASPGTLMLAGVSWSYSRWIVFAEYRSLETKIDYDGAIDNFSLSPVRTASVPIHMTQTIAGIKYRF